MNDQSINEGIRVAVCICTRKRQKELLKLLQSLNEMEAPEKTDVSIIIVENDTEPFSEKFVRDYSLTSRYETHYFLEPKQGIVNARNRSVAEATKADFCCFTDDDEEVSPGWLVQLLKCQREYDADGVAGPTFPNFTGSVPGYIRNFHQPKVYPYGTKVNSAFTGCLLMRKSTLDQLDGPFDIRLNFSGGEDSFMSETLTKMGATIRFNPEAYASEIIPADRSTLKYVFNKTIRISNTRLIIESLKDKNFNPASQIPRLILRFFRGLLILLPCLIFCREEKLDGLIKIVRAIGGFSFFFGRKSSFYKK
jgi:succinoglycan biosynthesis protein ExoM